MRGWIYRLVANPASRRHAGFPGVFRDFSALTGVRAHRYAVVQAFVMRGWIGLSMRFLEWFLDECLNGVLIRQFRRKAALFG